jgi:hypothetical protein
MSLDESEFYLPDSKYYELVKSDRAIVEAFQTIYEESPEYFSPVEGENA